MTSYLTRTLLILYCLYAWVAIALAQSPEAKLEALLQRHLSAIGGAAALEAIENLQIELTIHEPGFSISGHYRATRSGQMRIDIYSEGNRVYSEGIDENGGWQQQGDGEPVEAISSAGLEALQKGIENNFWGLHELPSRGHLAKYIGRQSNGTTQYDVLEITMQDGSQRQLFLDIETALVSSSREVIALHPDLDPTLEPTETVHSNYASHCGVLRSMEELTRNVATTEELQHTFIVILSYMLQFQISLLHFLCIESGMD